MKIELLIDRIKKENLEWLYTAVKFIDLIDLVNVHFIRFITVNLLLFVLKTYN